MPVVSAKLSQTDLIALNRLLEQSGYATLGQFLRDFARSKVAIGSATASLKVDQRLTSLEQKVDLLGSSGRSLTNEPALERMGPAGFEPATSSARGWHPAKLDNGPQKTSAGQPHYIS